MGLWETLLMVKLIDGVQKTYLFTNKLIIARKRQSKSLRKVVPISTPRKTQKFEYKERIFTKRNMIDIIESHYNATMVSKRINNLFGFPILATLANNFLSSSLNLYYIVVIVRNIERGNKPSPLSLAVFWPFAIMIGQTILIVRSFDKLATEVEVYCYF